LSVTSSALFYTASSGFIVFRFLDNLQVDRVESHHAYVSGIELLSVRNSKISDCYIHDIRDKQSPANVHYGIVVGLLRRTSASPAAASRILGMQ
jgi:hypothetical protein